MNSAGLTKPNAACCHRKSASAHTISPVEDERLQLPVERPVAVPAAILMGLGFSPIRAAVVVLLANPAPVAFGAIAMPELLTVLRPHQRAVPRHVPDGFLRPLELLVEQRQDRAEGPMAVASGGVRRIVTRTLEAFLIAAVVGLDPQKGFRLRQRQRLDRGGGEEERPDIARARRAWRRRQPGFDPARLIFLDESGAKTNMTRLRGRAPRGVSGSMPALRMGIGAPRP